MIKIIMNNYINSNNIEYPYHQYLLIIIVIAFNNEYQ